MKNLLALNWRVPLAIESLFYFRTCKNWRDVLRGRFHEIPFDRFELWSGPIISFSNPPPWQIFQEIWRFQTYVSTIPHERFMPQNVVDIGANIGIFSLFATQKWRGAQVWAFEPAPDNFQRLKQNIQLSSESKIHPYAEAVAGASGHRSLSLKLEIGWHSFSEEGAISTITVETKTLESILEEIPNHRIDVLKMDCEGAEYEILDGRASLLSDHVKYVTMEYHEGNQNTVRDLEIIFAKAGFSVRIEPQQPWNTGMLYAINKNDRPMFR